MSDKLQAALRYAARGWHVFPIYEIEPDGRCSCGRDCTSPGKHPRTPKGFLDATTDENLIHVWWETYPNANVGIRTGPPSGVLVVDMDPKNGGIDSFDRLSAAIGGFPPTYRVHTGGDGMHLYFRYPSFEVRNSESKIAPGIDVRGDGGYVVAPPSNHKSGNVYYEDVEYSDICDLPPALVATLKAPPKAEKKAEKPVAPATSASGTTLYGMAALRGEMETVANAPEGQRNSRLNKSAFRIGQLVGGGEVSMADAQAFIVSAAQSAGLPEREARKTFQNGVTAGTNHPRQAEPSSTWGGHRKPPEPGEDWPDPVPIDQFGAPEFPLDSFHYKHKDWILDIAKGAQVAPDMPGTILLSVVSTTLAKKFEVKVGGRWTEPLNIWTMVTAETGERKTPILTEAKAPLVDHEIDRQINEKEDIIRQRATHKAAEGRLAAAIKALSRSPNDTSLIKAHEDAVKNLSETPEPRHAFRLVGDDTTPEALVAMMAHQGERLALFSSEGGMLKTVMGAQYNAKGAANRDVLLKTYSGESIAQDRKNSASANLRRPALTLGLFVQPSVLNTLIRDTENSDLGLLSRFLLCNCPSRIGYRNVDLVDPDPMAVADFRKNIRDLLDLPMPEKPDIIPLAADALKTLNAFRQEIEDRMREDGDLYHFRDFGAKLPGQVVRIAGNLAIAESVMAYEGVPHEIPKPVMDNSIRLGRYYLAHAVQAIRDASLDRDAEDAKRVLAWIRRHPSEVVLVRDIFQGLKGPRSTIQTMDDLRRPIVFLVNSNWLVIHEAGKSSMDPPRALKVHKKLLDPS